MKTLTSTVLLCAALLPLPNADCGALSSAFQASLTVVESCRIDAGANAPQVRCLAATPSNITPLAAHAALDSTGERPLWIVTF